MGRIQPMHGARFTAIESDAGERCHEPRVVHRLPLRHVPWSSGPHPAGRTVSRRMVPRSRGYWRRLKLGLPTVVGTVPRGFFIPYRYADRIPQARPPYGFVEEQFRRYHEDYLDLLEAIDELAPDLQRINGEPPPQPRWEQDWFPRLDAAAAYTIVRRAMPRRIVEIGAGHSTRFFARAVRDGAFATRITAIDPEPRANLDGLDIELIRETVEQVSQQSFAELESGDILSIDSSHILMPGTDVDVLCNRILPNLPPGVYVHFHDIFLPDDYPREWRWRGYNEQCLIAAMLMCGEWEVLWPSHYVHTRLASFVQDTVIGRLPMKPKAYEASLWLEKRHRFDDAGDDDYIKEH